MDAKEDEKTRGRDKEKDGPSGFAQNGADGPS